MKTKEYYNKLKQDGNINNSIDFSKLDLNDWISLLNDFYHDNTILIKNIIPVPKGETINSYFLPIINEQNITIKKLFAEATETLIKSNYQNKNYKFLNKALNSIRYLEISIDITILKDIVLNNEVEPDIKINVANTLSVVNSNLLVPFWNEIDLSKNLFLIPSYITYFQDKYPVLGLKKLLLIKDTPEDLVIYDTILLNCLKTIFVNESDFKEYQLLYPKFPKWVKELILNMFEDYPKLNVLNKISQNPEIIHIFNLIHKNKNVIENFINEFITIKNVG